MSRRCVQQPNHTAVMMYGFLHVAQRRASRQLGSDELQIHHTGGDGSVGEVWSSEAVLFGAT